ncbi:MAG: para-aminobenzoate synthetase [Actinomycetota bacterium]|jgi:para-aminobenzoate synthetase|nr:para-aminobenzoate synthetase [Actinomycetota bacterium]
MDVLLIDNYDSFTFNLFQLIGSILGVAPRVVRNDEVGPDELYRMRPDAVVISPGPGHPGRERDFGVSKAAIADLGVPLLGVCLGHQGLAQHFGADVREAPEVMHGRTSEITHDGSPLFAGIPQRFRAVRYHSLAVWGPLPDELALTAWTDDGVTMGIRHRTRLLWGVQFHPESIGTEHGERLLRNFLDLAAASKPRVPDPSAPAPAASRAGREARSPALRVRTRVLPFLPDAESTFAALFGGSDGAFWLDSSLSGSGRARFSYLGGLGGPRAAVVSYDSAGHHLTVSDAGGTHRHRGDVLEFLENELAGGPPRIDDELPFGFVGGFVGYLGYELKRDLGFSAVHHSPLPDASLLFADRVIVLDHEDRRLYLLAVTAADDPEDSERWFVEMEACLGHLRGPRQPRDPSEAGPGVTDLTLLRDEAGYLDDIRRCQEEIRRGESYQLCLTNMISTDPVGRPLDLYRVLRAESPAPYAAYLRFGSTSVLCSSPERFLRITSGGQVTAQPIKGTAARSSRPAQDGAARDRLAASVKERAENLMIVDLLRNDLGRVCQLGTVEVPALMDVESFATVHQLVSTIAGQLRPDVTAVDCVRAAFPGGSMTGAPKHRTAEILDRLERGARGVYSGSIGWFGLDGAAELNVVIRTAVATPTSTSIGVGGAIVALSDPESEFDETLLKAAALIRSLGILRNGIFEPDDVRIDGSKLSPERSALLLSRAPPSSTGSSPAGRDPAWTGD